jgi:hypothetical protein
MGDVPPSLRARTNPGPTKYRWEWIYDLIIDKEGERDA